MKTSHKSDELKKKLKKGGEGPQIGYLWLSIYHGTDNIIKQSFISSSSCPNNIFYEIETLGLGTLICPFF
jgi:hypothetical protein